MNNKKIGVGIVTYNRPKQLQTLLNSIAPNRDEIELVVVNDGKPYETSPLKFGTFLENETNLGVGKSKNRCLAHLLNVGCENLFLIEDDVFVKRSDVFAKYIEASELTGIQHFNFSQHGLCNKVPYTNVPRPRKIIDYGTIKIPLYIACVGAFSFYTKRSLENCLMDETFYNACEHVEHTHRIHLRGMHPPFWWYPDIENSQDYIGDEEWSHQQSVISSRKDVETIWAESDKYFAKLYGCRPPEMKDTDFVSVANQLKQIKKTYGLDSSNL